MSHFFPILIHVIFFLVQHHSSPTKPVEWLREGLCEDHLESLNVQ